MADDSFYENNEDENENLRDPKYLLSLIDKYVSVKLLKSCTYTGFVHSIDPISYSIILLVQKGDHFKPVVIMGHSVLGICEMSPIDERRPQRKINATISREELDSRKEKVVAWLKKNFLPITENNDVIDVGSVSILPPYTTKNLCTDSPIVAAEFRKILENMPEDFQP